MLKLVQKVGQLGGFQHLQRERAEKELKEWAFTLSNDEVYHEEIQVAKEIFNHMFVSSRWEDRFGAIQGSAVLLNKVQQIADQQTENKEKFQAVATEFKAYMWDQIMMEKYQVLLLDSEFRVRNAAGTMLKNTFMSDKPRAIATFEQIKKLLLDNIESTFNRDDAQDASGAIKPKIAPDKDSGKSMHDTEGWKSLETSMRNL